MHMCTHVCVAVHTSCTLGDFFGAPSCGARFSGMTVVSKGNKSADATTPLRRTARGSWSVIQNGSNWHAIPVQVPLTNTENEKNEHFYRKNSHFDFFPVKIRGTNRKTRYAKKRQTRMGHGNSVRNTMQRARDDRHIVKDAEKL